MFQGHSIFSTPLITGLWHVKLWLNSVYYVVDLHYNWNKKNIGNHAVELIMLTILATNKIILTILVTLLNMYNLMAQVQRQMDTYAWVSSLACKVLKNGKAAIKNIGIQC